MPKRFFLKHAQATGVTWADTKQLDLNGTNQYVTLGTSGLNFSNGSSDDPFSISVIIDGDVANEKKVQILGNYGSSSGVQFIFGTRGGGQLFLIMYDGSTSNWIQGFNINNISGIKQHVCCTYDGSGVRTGITMYVNGTANTSYANAGSYTAMSASGDQKTIGVRLADSEYYDGKINELAVWDKELSAAEVTADYNSGTAYDKRTSAFASNLIHYWPFEDTLDDIVGGLNGTGVNSPSFVSS